MYVMSHYIRIKEDELEQLTSDINFNANNSILLTGSPMQPRLSQLLEFSHDGVIFTHHVSAQVKNVLNYLKEPSQSISSEWLQQSLSIDTPTYCRMKFIVFNTKFCNQNLIL